MAHGGIAAASVEDIVRLLDLSPHPEGGFYRETFRDPIAPGRRAASTAIYFLLPGGAPSRWHRVDAAEAWHFYAGAPLELLTEAGARAVRKDRRGSGRRRTPAGDRARGRMAGGAVARRVDAGRLHGGAGIRIRAFRGDRRRAAAIDASAPMRGYCSGNDARKSCRSFRKRASNAVV